MKYVHSTVGTSCLLTQAELHLYPDAALSDSLDDETANIFGNVKFRCCEDSSFLSPTGEAKVCHSLNPLPY